MPKISIIIPCYNVEEYLEECLDSVFKQTFKDFEVICVEDASTDDTKKILQQYGVKYKNIHIIYNAQNQGLAISRNIGLDAAKGDYIFFLDSDDSISKSCLSSLYQRIIQDKSDIVFGQTKAYQENPNSSSSSKQIEKSNEWLSFAPFRNRRIFPKNAPENYVQLHCCAWNKLYKTDFIRNNNLYFINQKCFHEDNGFWLKVLACNPTISGIGETTYFYRIRSGSITQKTKGNKQLHKENLKDSLKDALNFVRAKNHVILADFIDFKICQLEKQGLISFIWRKQEKHLKIFNFPIFRLKQDYNKEKYVLKIFGIVVYKWRKTLMKNSIAI